MSKFQARLASDQLVGRPALVSQTYSGRGIGPSSEVTSDGMMHDLRELANADPAREAVAYAERCQVMASTYGFDVAESQKPFMFADGFALIPMHGLLINRFSYSWGFVTGYNFLRTQVAAALADDDVKAIIFDVNSCGGMVAGCQETSDLMFAANGRNGGKPLIAVVDANCYSAAYYLASQCDHIAITPSGGCANIGVVMMHFDISAMMEDAGVKVTYIIAGAHKVDGNMYEPLSVDVLAEFQAEIDATYDQFVAAVVQGRGLDDQAVRDTEARHYSAVDALALGLVDAIQNPSDAVESYFASCDAGEDDDDADPGDTSDDDPPEPMEHSMTVRPGTPAARVAAPAAAAAATSEVTSADVATAAADARQAERVRISAIQGHAEAEGRTSLATHLAMNTDMDAEAAVAILAASPKTAAAAAPVVVEAAAAVVAPVAEVNHFANAMNNGQQPNVGAGGGAEAGSVTPAARILAAQTRATGARAPVTKH